MHELNSRNQGMQLHVIFDADYYEYKLHECTYDKPCCLYSN